MASAFCGNFFILHGKTVSLLTRANRKAPLHGITEHQRGRFSFLICTRATPWKEGPAGISEISIASAAPTATSGSEIVLHRCRHFENLNLNSSLATSTTYLALCQVQLTFSLFSCVHRRQNELHVMRDCSPRYPLHIPAPTDILMAGMMVMGIEM